MNDRTGWPTQCVEDQSDKRRSCPPWGGERMHFIGFNLTYLYLKSVLKWFPVSLVCMLKKSWKGTKNVFIRIPEVLFLPVIYKQRSFCVSINLYLQNIHKMKCVDLKASELYFHKLLQSPHKKCCLWPHKGGWVRITSHSAALCIFPRTFMTLRNGLRPVKDSLTVGLLLPSRSGTDTSSWERCYFN